MSRTLPRPADPRVTPLRQERRSGMEETHVAVAPGTSVRPNRCVSHF